MDDSMPGELIPPENWRPQVLEYLAYFQEEYPEEFDLLAVRRDTPELFELIVQKCHELDQLGPATEETILRLLREIEGLFSQWRWRRQGYGEAEMALDENGWVIALRIHGRDFDPQRPHLKRLIGGWATTDPEFQSPSGDHVYQLEKLEALLTMTDAEQIAFLDSKLH